MTKKPFMRSWVKTSMLLFCAIVLCSLAFLCVMLSSGDTSLTPKNFVAILRLEVDLGNGNKHSLNANSWASTRKDLARYLSGNFAKPGDACRVTIVRHGVSIREGGFNDSAKSVRYAVEFDRNLSKPVLVRYFGRAPRFELSTLNSAAESESLLLKAIENDFKLFVDGGIDLGLLDEHPLH